MSIESSAMIIVGLPEKELQDVFEESCYSDFVDWMETHWLDNASPYYDAPIKDWIVGVTVFETRCSELPLNTFQKVHDAMDEFKEATGKSGKVYLTLDTY